MIYKDNTPEEKKQAKAENKIMRQVPGGKQLSWENNELINLGSPTQDNSAATKKYVDDTVINIGTVTKKYVDDGDAATLNSAKAHADSGDATTLQNANTYTDNKITSIGAVTKTYVDNQDAATLTSANSYTDAEIAKIPSADVDKAYVDQQDAATLQSAKDYADSLPHGEAVFADGVTKTSEVDIEKVKTTKDIQLGKNTKAAKPGAILLRTDIEGGQYTTVFDEDGIHSENDVTAPGQVRTNKVDWLSGDGASYEEVYQETDGSITKASNGIAKHTIENVEVAETARVTDAVVDGSITLGGDTITSWPSGGASTSSEVVDDSASKPTEGINEWKGQIDTNTTNIDTNSDLINDKADKVGNVNESNLDGLGSQYFSAKYAWDNSGDSKMVADHKDDGIHFGDIDTGADSLLIKKDELFAPVPIRGAGNPNDPTTMPNFSQVEGTVSNAIQDALGTAGWDAVWDNNEVEVLDIQEFGVSIDKSLITDKDGTSPIATSLIYQGTLFGDEVSWELIDENIKVGTASSGIWRIKWDVTDLVYKSNIKKPKYAYIDIEAPLVDGHSIEINRTLIEWGKTSAGAEILPKQEIPVTEVQVFVRKLSAAQIKKLLGPKAEKLKDSKTDRWILSFTDHFKVDGKETSFQDQKVYLQSIKKNIGATVSATFNDGVAVSSVNWGDKANKSETYTKTETEARLATKANGSIYQHDGSGKIRTNSKLESGTNTEKFIISNIDNPMPYLEIESDDTGTNQTANFFDTKVSIITDDTNELSPVNINYFKTNNADLTNYYDKQETDAKFVEGDLDSVVIGKDAGSIDKGIKTVAIGTGAGRTSQDQHAVAMGSFAAYDSQGEFSVAIGYNSGKINQNKNSVALGSHAGETNQGTKAVAIGNYSGNSAQGANSIAIGDGAGKTNQPTNSIYIKANNSNPTNPNENEIKLEAGTTVYEFKEDGIWLNGVNIVPVNKSLSNIVINQPNHKEVK